MFILKNLTVLGAQTKGGVGIREFSYKCPDEDTVDDILSKNYFLDVINTLKEDDIIRVFFKEKNIYTSIIIFEKYLNCISSKAITITEEASEDINGSIKIATTEEVNDGIIDNKAVTPAKLKPYIEEKLNKAIKDLGVLFELKGTLETFANLPTENNQVGDVWYVKDKSVNYIWLEVDNSFIWEEFGPIINFEEFAKGDEVYTKQEVDTLLEDLNVEIPTASNTEAGIIQIATDLEFNDGTNETKAVNSKQVNDKINNSLEDIYTKTEVYNKTEVTTLIEENKLTAGENIIIENGVISATGGSGEGWKIDYTNTIEETDYIIGQKYTIDFDCFISIRTNGMSGSIGNTIELQVFIGVNSNAFTILDNERMISGAYSYLLKGIVSKGDTIRVFESSNMSNDKKYTITKCPIIANTSAPTNIIITAEEIEAGYDFTDNTRYIAASPINNINMLSIDGTGSLQFTAGDNCILTKPETAKIDGNLVHFVDGKVYTIIYSNNILFISQGA